MSSFTARLVVAAGIAYLVLLYLAIPNTTYDVWGVLIVGPAAIMLGAGFVHFAFRGRFRHLRNIMYAGFAAKLVGTAFRYYVGFEAYEGGIDAARYHDYGVEAARAVWAGDLNILDIFPAGIGTAKMEGVAGLVYTFTGTSQMAGFVTFSLLAYIGIAYFVKAAVVAVPGLADRRYAVLCILAPSLVYWPSSIGKDAVMLLTIGIAAYALAQVMSGESVLRPLLAASAVLALEALIRPQIVGIFVAGAFPAVMMSLLRGGPAADAAELVRRRTLFIPILLAGALGLAILSSVTVNYLDPTTDLLNPADGDESTIDSIINETERRTAQAGSAFDPPDIGNPVMWPYAAVRTLTRPLPIEVSGIAQMFTALEMTIFLVLCLVSWRRLFNTPRLMMRNPYVLFAVITLFLLGLAFSSFANLAVLTRQKSIAFPFLLLLVCLPPLPPRRRGEDAIAAVATERARSSLVATTRRPVHDDAAEESADTLADGQNSSTSPIVSDQLGNGGMPSVHTPRQVRTGPPPGKRSTIDDIWGAPSRTV